MYRIRMADGSEAAYATVEEFSIAVQEGRVPNTAEIYHQRAEKWLAIAAHPHFKAALEQSGKRPAVRIPGRHEGAAPTTTAAPQQHTTAPRIHAHPGSPTAGTTTAPRIPSAQPSAHTTVPHSIADSGSRPALSHRNGTKPQLAPELMRLAAAAAAPKAASAPAPAPSIAPAPDPAPAPATAHVPATVPAPTPRATDPTDGLELLPENELPPVTPPGASKPAFSPLPRPKALPFRPSGPVAAVESPLHDLHPLEPEAPHADLAVELPPAPAPLAAPEPEPAVPTSTSWQLEGLPVVEVPEPGPLPFVTDHAHALVPAPARGLAAPVAAAPAEASVSFLHLVDETATVSAPRSKRGLLMAAGIAALLVIAVSAFLLRPSAAKPASAESVKVSTSAAQQAPAPQQAQPQPTPPPAATNTPPAEPTVARTARVEPAPKPVPAARNRVDPTPAEAANEEDGEVVPVGRLPMPAAIDANIKTGADSAGPTLIDRTKALEAARKAIVEKPDR